MEPFNPDQWMDPKDQRRVDAFIVYAMAAARQALDDAGWHPKSYDDQAESGVPDRLRYRRKSRVLRRPSLTLRDRGPRKISPFFIPGRLINLAPATSPSNSASRAPIHSVVTACSTGAHAIGDAGASDRPSAMPR